MFNRNGSSSINIGDINIRCDSINDGTYMFAGPNIGNVNYFNSISLEVD